MVLDKRSFKSEASKIFGDDAARRDAKCLGTEQSGDSTA